MTAIWLVQRSADAGFPFRIAIEQDGRTLFVVRAKAAWPGAGSQIPCLRERELDLLETSDDVERAPIARVGRKLSVTLERAQRKRCEFLILKKPRKNGSGTCEQVFFRSEAEGARTTATNLRSAAVAEVTDSGADSREAAYPAGSNSAGYAPVALTRPLGAVPESQYALERMDSTRYIQCHIRSQIWKPSCLSQASASLN